MRFIKIVPLILLTIVIAGKGMSHELWISPESFLISSDTQVQANIRVGQNFGGSSYSYNPSSFVRFETRFEAEVTPAKGRLGDIPALSLDAPGEGLLTVVYETDDNVLSYTVWEKFVKFVQHKDFATTLADHDARGIAQNEKFSELYRRYAKSLIAIGNGAGSDTEVGLKTEIIAMENPYTMSGDILPVKVLLDGMPRANAQVELFEKAPDGTVAIVLFRTGDDGIAELPVKRGYSYLADAVAMLPLENDDPKKGSVWWSLWASLTFAVPQAPLN